MTANGDAPIDEATTLVVQVGDSWYDARLVNSNGDVIPAPEPPEGGIVGAEDITVGLPRFDGEQVEATLIAGALAYRQTVLVQDALGNLRALRSLVRHVGLRRASEKTARSIYEAASDRLQDARRLARLLSAHVDDTGITRLDGLNGAKRATTELLGIRLQCSTALLRQVGSLTRQADDSFEQVAREQLGAIVRVTQRSLATLREVNDDLALLQYVLA